VRSVSDLRSWLEAQKPMGLAIVDAESLPAGSIERMRYVPRDGSGGVERVRALGCALEHVNLGFGGECVADADYLAERATSNGCEGPGTSGTQER